MCRFLPQLVKTWTEVFGAATPLVSPMPLWHILHAFITTTPRGGQRFEELSAEDVDARLTSLLGEGRRGLKYYSGSIHRLMLTSRHPPYDTFVKQETKNLATWQGHNARGMSQMHECGCNSARCLFEDGHRGTINSRYSRHPADEGEEEENTEEEDTEEEL